MSRRYTIISTAVLFVVSASLFYGQDRTSSSHSSSSFSPRGQNMKLASLKPRFDQLIKTSKLKSPIHIELLNTTFTNEVEPGQLFRLQAQISSNQSIDKLRFEWILPEGLEVQNGSATTGEFSLKNVRDITTLQIELIQAPEPGQEESVWRLAKDSFNKQIHLRVFRDGRDNNFVTTAQYNTMTQAELNSQREELAQRNSDYITQSKSKD